MHGSSPHYSRQHDPSYKKVIILTFYSLHQKQVSEPPQGVSRWIYRGHETPGGRNYKNSCNIKFCWVDFKLQSLFFILVLPLQHTKIIQNISVKENHSSTELLTTKIHAPWGFASRYCFILRSHKQKKLGINGVNSYSIFQYVEMFEGQCEQ